MDATKVVFGRRVVGHMVVYQKDEGLSRVKIIKIILK
jgi:hypothetical protein